MNSVTYFIPPTQTQKIIKEKGSKRFGQLPNYEER